MTYIDAEPLSITAPFGRNSLYKASEYFNVISGANKFNLKSVYPEYDDTHKLIPKNIQELIPKKIVVIPHVLTIYTEYGEGFDRSDRNFFDEIDKEVYLEPAENCVFVYAFNESGKIIYPYSRCPSASDPEAKIGTYDLHVFGNHFNPRGANPSFVSSNELEIAGGYSSPNKPKINPPNALTVRSGYAGHYSVNVCAKLAHELCKNNNSIQHALADSAFEVIACDGPKNIDLLVVNESKPGKISKATGKPILKLRPGEEVVLSLSGRRNLYEYDEVNHHRRIRKIETVSLREMFWQYENVAETYLDSDETEVEPRLNLLPMDGSGINVRLIGGIPSLKGKTGGRISIFGHGKKFVINFEVDVCLKSHNQECAPES